MDIPAIHNRLKAATNVCEASAREAIDHLRDSARYDGSRFLYPDNQQAVRIWMELISNKETEVIKEIERILNAILPIDEDKVNGILSAVEDIFNDDFYANRLKSFTDSIARKVASYGLRPNDQDERFNLTNFAYQSGIRNKLRYVRSNISSELKVYISKRGIEMGFSALMTDTVNILKANGKKIEGVKASVQSTKIFIEGATHLIESGDLIQRKMSNGGEETFEVIDPGFHEKFHSISAGYQMTVRKLGIPEAKKAVQNITYNISGPNARVNSNSTDNSINTVTFNSEALQHIDTLRNSIRSAALQQHEKQAAEEVINAVEEQVKSGKASKPVVSALLAALPQAANIATIATALLTLL